MPQLSKLPPSTSLAWILALPLLSSCTVIDWQSAVGAVLSCTVTVALHVEAFPLKSVTVSVTVLSPVLLHVKLFGDTLSDPMPQLSKLPPSTSEPAIVTFPVLSRETVIDWQMAVGAVLSCTVTVALQLEVLPLKSVTVSVTVLSPVLLHVKLFGDTLSDPMPQLSTLPPSTSVPAIVTFPVLSRDTVRDWQSAV